MALVHDEYGHFDGLVTPANILDAVAGAMPTDELADQFVLRLPPSRNDATAAGLVIATLQRLPETCDIAGWRFEVVDLDGRRVDKLQATKLVESEAEELRPPHPPAAALRARDRSAAANPRDQARAPAR
ncbi:transporter associated domain-containing protein [Methylobacterium sp. J-088]|uniref:transporter associated domain-containing protein n=1 Tax=Methylobacterium sp. J-088 TaxID=2836664 RepID=UPI00391BF3DE